MKRYLRNWQTLAPWVRPLKFGFYNMLTRNFGMFIDPDFQLLRHFPQIRTALDIGGNWGQSIIAIRRLCPEATVTSFEPNPILADHLVRGHRADSKVTIRNIGLGSEAGAMTLYVPVYRSFVYDGLASLDPREAESWLNADRVANFDPDKLTIQQFNVTVDRLDNLDLQPDFVKIDVQGFELEVLRGASGMLKQQPLILLEGATDAIVEYLADFGLHPYRFTGAELVANRLDSVNTFFMTEDHARASGLVVKS